MLLKYETECVTVPTCASFVAMIHQHRTQRKRIHTLVQFAKLLRAFAMATVFMEIMTHAALKSPQLKPLESYNFNYAVFTLSNFVSLVQMQINFT